MFSKFSYFIFFFNCFLYFVACEHNSTAPLIVGGYRPKNGSLAKHVVSIRLEETEDHFGYTHFCAGSIIAKNKVLTAAHCFYRKTKRIPCRKCRVVAKTSNRLNRNEKTQVVDIKEAVLHPNYREDILFNDIAILILKNDILLEPGLAVVVPLTKENVSPGTVCQVIGWGRLYGHGPLANEILHVDLDLLSREYCRRKYPNFSGKKLCASSKDDPEKDACNGDSGGPMVCKGALTGIVSYGFGCALGHAGIYTNVYRYLDWINGNGQIMLKPYWFIIVKSFVLIILFIH